MTNNESQTDCGTDLMSYFRCVKFFNICKIGGVLSSISLATERVLPQEIPLHTILKFVLCFPLLTLFIWYFAALIIDICSNVFNFLYFTWRNSKI